MKTNKFKEIYLKILGLFNFNENTLFYIAGHDKLPPPLKEKEE